MILNLNIPRQLRKSGPELRPQTPIFDVAQMRLKLRVDDPLILPATEDTPTVGAVGRASGAGRVTDTVAVAVATRWRRRWRGRGYTSGGVDGDAATGGGGDAGGDGGGG